MEQRPDLNTSLDSQTFRQFYYLKEELVDFCKQNHIPTSGGKIELTENNCSNKKTVSNHCYSRNRLY